MLRRILHSYRDVRQLSLLPFQAAALVLSVKGVVTGTLLYGLPVWAIAVPVALGMLVQASWWTADAVRERRGF